MGGVWGGGVRCGSGALQTKGRESASEATVTTSIYLQPPVAKTLAAAIQRLSAVFFNQSQGVTLESKSTCSHVPPGLRRDGQDCQRATWNTWVRIKHPATAGVARMFYCRLNQLFVVLSFHVGLGPIKRTGTVELHQWVHLFPLAPPASWSWLYNPAALSRGCSLPNTVPAHVVKTLSNVREHTHMPARGSQAHLLSFFSHTNIGREDTAAHETPFRTLYTQRTSLSWRFIDPNRHFLAVSWMRCQNWWHADFYYLVWCV